MTKENLKGKSAVGKNLRRKSVFRYALIGQGIIIGVTTGLIIALFRWLLIFADGCRNRLVLTPTPEWDRRSSPLW